MLALFVFKIKMLQSVWSVWWPRRLTVKLWFSQFSCDFSQFSCNLWNSSVVIFHSSVVIFETVQLGFFAVQLWFLKQFSCDFWNSLVVIFHSSVVISHSLVVIFETVQLGLFTVQLWFLKQFSWDFSQFSCDFWNSSVVIFWLDERDWNITYRNWDRRVFISRHFGRRQSCSLVCVWQCLAFKTMDAIIRETVWEEIRCQYESASTSSEAATREPNQRTVSRLSGLLDRIRGQSRGKKRKSNKEHGIQVRWIHYAKKSEVFVPVRQKKGGGNRFVSYTAPEPPTVEELKQKATAFFSLTRKVLLLALLATCS